METQNKFNLCILTFLFHLLICPKTASSSALHMALILENAAIDITVNDNALQTFKNCTCNSDGQKCPLIAELADIDTVKTGYKITQFAPGETVSQYTLFSCNYIGLYPPISCDRKNATNYTCDCATTSNALLGLKCQGNPNVFITWDPSQEALVHDYDTTEFNLVQCCASSSTEKPTSSILDTLATTGERPQTTAVDNTAKIATTTTKLSVTAPRSKPATTTAKLEADSNSVTSSNVPTTTNNSTTNQNQHERHTQENAEFSPAYIGLVIGVCVASATVSVLITSFVMIKWHQRQEKSSNKANRSQYQERQNEAAYANNIGNHRDGNAIEMTETNTSHGTDAQGTSERSTGHGNIPHTNNNNPSSSILQYTATDEYTEVDVPSAGHKKAARNDAYTEVKKVSKKNSADTNNVNFTEDSTYSRLHATRRDMQNLYDILPHEVDDGHGGTSSPYSEVAVPKPGTVLSIL